MQNKDLHSEIQELQRKLDILTEENEILTERAEDIFLLGLISEKISVKDSPEDIMLTALEKISSLKEIAYCAELSISDGNTINILQDYGVDVRSRKGTELKTHGSILLKLQSHDCFVKIDDEIPLPDFIPDLKGGQRPNSYCFVPLKIRDRQTWMLFVNNISNSDYLKGLQPLLFRLGELVQARLETLSLIEQIRGLNAILEQKVVARTSELVESENKYRNLFDSIRDVIIVADKDRIILDANRRALREMFGYELLEIIGKRTSMLYATEVDFNIVGSEVFNSDNITVGKIMEIDFRRKDGTVFPSEMFAMKLLDDSGGIIGNFGIIRDITERRKAEVSIKASLREKEVLLQEIHHRVRNNMAVISALIQMQMHVVDDENVVQMLRETNQRVKSMVLVHEKLYRSKDLSEINVGDYVHELIKGISDSYGNSDVETIINVDNIPIALDTLMPFGLIVNEIVSNSFKHAFKDVENPQICLTLREEGSRAEMSISDNGCGAQVDGRHIKKRTLGMNIINSLVGQLNGKMQLTTNNGYQYRMSFPL